MGGMALTSVNPVSSVRVWVVAGSQLTPIDVPRWEHASWRRGQRGQAGTRRDDQRIGGFGDIKNAERKAVADDVAVAVDGKADGGEDAIEVFGRFDDVSVCKEVRQLPRPGGLVPVPTGVAGPDVPGKGSQPFFVRMPMRADAVLVGKGLPTKEVPRSAGVRPGQVFLRHKMELGWIRIVDARQQQGIDRLVGLAGDDHEGMHGYSVPVRMGPRISRRAKYATLP